MSPILLVEDNEDLRFIFAEVLRRDGYTVLEAGDGQVALDLLRALDPSPGLVLLDLMMPKVSGLEVLREVASTERLSGIPIVIVSASTESWRNPDRPVLKKPIEPRSLLDVARRYLPRDGAPSEVVGPRQSTRPALSRRFVQTLRAPGGEGMVVAPMPLQPLQGLRVLVVEDDEDSLDLVTFSLQGKGAVVEGARTAAAALALAQKALPDLLVADVELPDADGFSLLGQLHALPGAQQLPAVALTGHAAPAAGEKARRAGFNRLLTKPVSLAELTQVLVSLAQAQGAASVDGTDLAE